MDLFHPLFLLMKHDSLSKRFGRDWHNWHHGHLLASPASSSHQPLLLQKVSLVIIKPKDVIEECKIEKISPHSWLCNLTSWKLPAKQSIQFHTETTCIVQRWILSVTFKRDIIRDYGIYPESEDVLMEAVDQNEEYVQQAAGGEDQAN